jgi:hypothetical protein
MRIAAARGIDVNSLRSEEFDILKTFKKLEEREQLLNNCADFFDPKYEMHSVQPMAESI